MEIIDWTHENAEKISEKLIERVSDMSVERAHGIASESEEIFFPIYAVDGYIFPATAQKDPGSVIYVDKSFVEDHFDFDQDKAQTDWTPATLKGKQS